MQQTMYKGSQVSNVLNIFWVYVLTHITYTELAQGDNICNSSAIYVGIKITCRIRISEVSGGF